MIQLEIKRPVTQTMIYMSHFNNFNQLVIFLAQFVKLKEEHMWQSTHLCGSNETNGAIELVNKECGDLLLLTWKTMKG